MSPEALPNMLVQMRADRDYGGFICAYDPSRLILTSAGNLCGVLCECNLGPRKLRSSRPETYNQKEVYLVINGFSMTALDNLLVEIHLFALAVDRHANIISDYFWECRHEFQEREG